jgi:hypothetical protein
MEVFNLPLPSNDGFRPNTSQYCDVLGVTRHKRVSAVTDARLAAETVDPKELGSGVSAVTGL